MDGHMGIANSLAMKIAGIDKTTNDPIGRTIMRRAEGEPTGLLVDSAMVLMFGVIEKVTDMDSLLNRTLESDKIWTSGRRIFCLTYPSV